jgi:ankyrin repeat protein
MFILTVFLLVNTTLAQKTEGARVMDHISNFLAAAESGDTAKIVKSLNQGTEIDVTDEHGQTALMLAAYEGHVDTVRLLLQHGASPDLQNRLGGTALILASFNGHLEVVTELLKAGADVNAKSKNGYTALMQAAVKPNEAAVQIINLLLDQKADINAQDEEGYTALMRAVDHPPPPPPLPPYLRGAKKPKWYDSKQREAEIHFMIVKALVMRRADLNLKDQRGRTALDIARMNHLTQILEFLESR